MKTLISQLALSLVATLITLPAWAVGVVFKPVTEGVYAYVGDIEGRTYENEGLNANIGLVWLLQKDVLFSGDVVYVDRVLGLHPVSRTKTWLASFAVIDELKPKIIVPGHGQVTNLATAQTQTRDLLLALRSHMGKAVEAGEDLSAAVKRFDAKPFAHLKHAEVWIPQLANQTYLEMERE